MLSTHKKNMIIRQPSNSCGEEWVWRTVCIELGIPYVLIMYRAEIDGIEVVQTDMLWIEDDVVQFFDDQCKEIVSVAVLIPARKGSLKTLELLQIKEVWKSGPNTGNYPFYITFDEELIVLGDDERPKFDFKVLLYSQISSLS
jgi:hypothetical protein